MRLSVYFKFLAYQEQTDRERDKKLQTDVEKGRKTRVKQKVFIIKRDRISPEKY